MKLLLKLLFLAYAVGFEIGFAQLQIGQNIDGETEYDLSGESVSLSANGTRVAIGTGSSWNDGLIYSGQTRIFDQVINGSNGSTWVQLGQDIDGENMYDESGRSVSLSADGTRVAIGAPGGRNGEFYGHTRIFELINGSTWAQLGQNIDGEADRDFSGSSVSLSADGTRVAIGAIENNDGGSLSGHTRIFELSNGNTWVQLGQDIDGENEYERSGTSVSLSADGTRVAIGAPYSDKRDAAGRTQAAGRTRIFELSKYGNTWVQLGQDIYGENELDFSGGDVTISFRGGLRRVSHGSVSLSADGTRVAIGASLNDGNGDGAGHTRIFELIKGATWVQLGQDIDGENKHDRSGSSVSLSADGTRVAIGAVFSNDGNGYAAGHTRIFELINGATWVQLGQDVDGKARYDFSGASVCLSADGATVAIGAPSHHDGINNMGYTRIFSLANATVPPTPKPTNSPTLAPTNSPTSEPTNSPTSEPTNSPTLTSEPTNSPTLEPTNSPTLEPTNSPNTKEPTNSPTSEPTNSPTSASSSAIDQYTSLTIVMPVCIVLLAYWPDIAI